MKTKKFNKSLILNKQIIASLNYQEAKGVKGGLDTDVACSNTCSVGCPPELNYLTNLVSEVIYPSKDLKRTNLFIYRMNTIRP